MTVRKIYIMSTAASGKSTFARKFPSFEGYKIVDFAQELPSRSALTKVLDYLSRVAPFLEESFRKRKDMIALDNEHYFASVFAYLTRQTEPVVVLGRRTPEYLEDYERFNDVAFAMVLVPEEDYRRNCKARKRESRNRLPFFHHWSTDFTRIMDDRKKSRGYAKRHNIPVFESFSSAIRAMPGKESQNGKLA